MPNISFKVPEKYSNRIFLEENSINIKGVAQKSAYSYLSGDGKFSVEIYKNKTAWNESLSKEVSNGNIETEVIKIKSGEVQVFHDSSSSKAFFEANNSYLIVRWNSKTIDKEIKAILKSFN